MEVVRRIADLRAVRRGWRESGLTVGLIPTMGGLHKGHVSLVRRSQDMVDRTILTVFVNQAQFSASEGFDAYPRDEQADLDLARKVGANLVYAPSQDEIYPPRFATAISIDGLADVLCGASRPGHFDGVALVVAKLLNQSEADAAFFGEKDWQQLQIIRRMAWDLDFPGQIIGCPTERHEDGLAISTRNALLSDSERVIAPALHNALAEAAQRIADGEPTELACAEAQENLLFAGFPSVEYLECRDAISLRLTPSPGVGARIFGAARLGAARLIDNVRVPSR